MNPPPGHHGHRHRAFTRTELLVTLTTLLLLTTLTRPLWGNGSPSRNLVCMDNLRRLQAAWLLYTADQGSRMPFNPTIDLSQNPTAGRIGWVSGVMSWDTAQHNTNTAYLSQSRYAVLEPYAGPDPSLYKCPADTYLSSLQASRGWYQRVRSYAMNGYVGSTTEFFPAYRYYLKLSDFRRLPPQRAFVFLEEHPDSINDPMYITTFQNGWSDIPAAFHEGSCWFSFADGHLELRRWQSPSTLVPVRYLYTPPVVRPNDPDLAWVQARSSELK